MNRLLQGVSILAFAGMGISSAFAQTAETTADTVDDRRLTAVTVTATKRSESAQTIPVTVTALGEQELESLGVSNFTDYLVQLAAEPMSEHFPYP